MRIQVCALNESLFALAAMLTLVAASQADPATERTNDEDINALAIEPNVAPLLDLDADDSAHIGGADFHANFDAGAAPVAIVELVVAP